MNRLTKLLALTATAAATSLLVAACGGGDASPPSASSVINAGTTAAAPDAKAPTVTIFDDTPAATATGPVVFTFVFSEDVGASFTASDVVVTGGTAGVFTKVSATQATLVVTPTANTAGTINVSVAAATFSDLAGNSNTAGATAQQAYNSVVLTQMSLPVSFDSTSVGYGLVGFGGAEDSTIVADPTLATNKVAKVVRAAGSETYAGTTITATNAAGVQTGLSPKIPFNVTDTRMTVRVWSPDAGIPVRLKVEDSADPTKAVETEASVTTAAGWQTLTFDFAAPATGTPALNLGFNYNKATIFFDFGRAKTAAVQKTYYFDDLTFLPGAAGGGGGGGACGTTTPTCAPTTTVPAGATVIYTDAASVTGINKNPDWGQSPAVVFAEPTIAGNKSLKYTFGGSALYEGIDWSANAVNVSAQSKLHLDFFSADITSVKVSIISAGKENAVTKAVTSGSWNAIDIDLSLYTVPDKTAIIQIKLEPSTTGTLYVDNIYFYSAAAGASCGTTTPTCAPSTVIPSGSTVIYSDAASVTGIAKNPDWGQSPAVVFSEPTIAGNKSLKYTFGGTALYEGIDWAGSPQDVSSKGNLHLDFFSPDITSVKVSIISAGKENFVTKAVTPGSWNGIDIDMSLYTVPAKNAIIQIKLEPSTVGTLYVDNIYFSGTASASGGAASCAASVAMGTGGTQTAVLSAGDSKGLFAAGEAIFAVDYKGTLDSLGHYAAWTNARTDGAAKCGDIGYYNDTAMSASSQKLDEGGWIVGTSDDPAGTPNFFRYFVLTAPSSTFSSSYIGLFVNAPNNGTLDVSSFGSIKFRLWGPAEMYQQSNLNPVIEMVLSGPKVAGCSTGSGGTEISRNVTASQKIGAGSVYKVALAAFTVKGVCGSDTAATAVSAVLSKLSRVSFTAPASSFNFVNPNPGTPVSWSSGINLGPVGFTNF